MKLHVLGSGGAFSDKFGNTQFYIENEYPETSLLFDCGISHMENTLHCNFDRSKIQNIFISHLHDDHVAGLGTLALMHYFMPNFYKKPNLYIHISLIGALWQRLAPGLETIEDGRLAKGKYKCDINDFFNVKVIDSNSVFHLGNMTCRPVQTIHVVHGAEFMNSYGLEITDESTNKRILFTSDTQFAPDQLRNRQKTVDIIIHDCETGFRSGVHAHLDDLKTLPKEIREKIYICHYGDNIEAIEESIKDEFKGVLKRKMIIEI